MAGLPMMLLLRADDGDGDVRDSIFFYCSCAVLFLDNHVVLPFCVIQLKWSPLFSCKSAFLAEGELAQSCMDYSFFGATCCYGAGSDVSWPAAPLHQETQGEVL